MRGERLGRGAAALVAATAFACGGPETPARGPFQAVWIGAESAPLSRGEATRLAAAGAGELFVDAARVGWGGKRPELRELPLAALPRETPATLVVLGAWSAPPESPRRLAAAWSERIDALAIAARAAGAVPVGVHFDLEISADAEPLAALLARLRRELRGRLAVSVTVDPDVLEERALAALAEAVDFVVADVFGQPPTAAADDAGRWDLAWSRARIARLERIGAPYVVVAWTLARSELAPRRGESTPVTAALPLAAMLRDARLLVRPGAVFAGVDRQVFALEARQPLAVAGYALARGDVVRVARPTTHDLEDLLAALPSAATSRRVGLVLRRLPAPGDELSLGAGSLAAALEPGAAAPELDVSLVPAGSRRGRSLVRVRLENRNAEATELGGGEWNYVQLEFPAGTLGAVDPGDFVGWEQLWQGRERRTVRALREADTLRLFAPYVGGDETLESGTIELRARNGARPAVRTSARFILPGGREHLLPPAPARWLDED